MSGRMGFVHPGVNSVSFSISGPFSGAFSGSFWGPLLNWNIWDFEELRHITFSKIHLGPFWGLFSGLFTCGEARRSMD